MSLIIVANFMLSRRVSLALLILEGSHFGARKSVRQTYGGLTGVRPYEAAVHIPAHRDRDFRDDVNTNSRAT